MLLQYEPYYYKGHLADLPLTLAYGQSIDVLRRKDKAWLWAAQFRDTVGATVSANASHRYSVLVGASGKRAGVIINQESGKAITAKVALPKAAKPVEGRPEEPEAQPMPGTLQIPARSAVVVMAP